MVIRKRYILMILAVLSSFWVGCGLPFGDKAEQNVSLRIVKSGIKIEKADYNQKKERQMYKLTVPVEIMGTCQKDHTIPVRYDYEYDHSEFWAAEDASFWAREDKAVSCEEGKLKITKGTTGLVYFEGYLGNQMLSEESSWYQYVWIAFRYKDEFMDDNYAVIDNPEYDPEKGKSQNAAIEAIRNRIPTQTAGDVWIDEDSIRIKKTYVGEEENHPQHYTVKATIQNDADNPVETDDLWIGCDYDMPNPFTMKDCYEGLNEALIFMRGVSLGYTVEQKSIHKEDDQIEVEFDIYNRYSGKENNLTGTDLDWYQCFWIAISLDDDNRNNNYVLLPNPYYKEENYGGDFTCKHHSDEIYANTSVEAWKAYFDEHPLSSY